MDSKINKSYVLFLRHEKVYYAIQKYCVSLIIYLDVLLQDYIIYPLQKAIGIYSSIFWLLTSMHIHPIFYVSPQVINAPEGWMSLWHLSLHQVLLLYDILWLCLSKSRLLVNQMHTLTHLASQAKNTKFSHFSQNDLRKFTIFQKCW